MGTIVLLVLCFVFSGLGHPMIAFFLLIMLIDLIIFGWTRKF